MTEKRPNALRGKIFENFKSITAFARQMGRTKGAICKKINGEIEWKASEIYKASRLLNIKPEDWETYFMPWDGELEDYMEG